MKPTPTNRRHGRWRLRAHATIAQAMLVAGDEVPPDALRRILRVVYPFGERKRWPYRVWLDEINRQLRAGRYARGLPRAGLRDIPGQTFIPFEEHRP